MAQFFTSVRYDEASPTVFYVGKAVAGKVDEDPAWLIIRYTKTANGIMSEYAKGGEFSYYPWIDRLTLEYK